MKSNQILRSPSDAGTGSFANADEALAAQPENVVDPILMENLDDVSSSDPLFPKGDYECEVVKVTQAPTAKGGNMIKYELKTLQDHQAVTGETIPAGRRIFGQISITPTPKYDKATIQRNLKRFQEAVGDTGNFYPLDKFVGTRLVVKLGMNKPTDEYPDERNEVKGFAAKKN